MPMLVIHNWQEKSQELHTLSADLDQVTTTYLQSLGEVMTDFMSDSLENAVLFIGCANTNREFLWLLLTISIASPHTLCLSIPALLPVSRLLCFIGFDAADVVGCTFHQGANKIIGLFL